MCLCVICACQKQHIYCNKLVITKKDDIFLQKVQNIKKEHRGPLIWRRELADMFEPKKIGGEKIILKITISKKRDFINKWIEDTAVQQAFLLKAFLDATDLSLSLRRLKLPSSFKSANH